MKKPRSKPKKKKVSKRRTLLQRAKGAIIAKIKSEAVETIEHDWKNKKSIYRNFNGKILKIELWQ